MYCLSIVVQIEFTVIYSITSVRKVYVQLSPSLTTLLLSKSNGGEELLTGGKKTISNGNFFFQFTKLILNIGIIFIYGFQ